MESQLTDFSVDFWTAEENNDRNEHFYDQWTQGQHAKDLFVIGQECFE